MFKAIRYMRARHWALFACNTLLVFLQVYFDLKIPDYMAKITVLVKTEGSAMADIWLAGGMMLLFSILGVLITIFGGFITARLSASYSHDLREMVFMRVESFSMEEISHFSTASLITRCTNDVMQLQNFVSQGLRMIVRAPIMVAWALYKMSTKQWEWTALTAGAVVMVIGTVAFIITYAHPRIRRMQGLTDDLNAVTRENMTGIRVIRAYNAEHYQQNKFEQANERLTRNSLAARRAMGLINPVMRFANNGLTVGIYCVGIFLIAAAGATEQLEIFSDMVVFSTYASKLLMAFMSLNFIFMMLPRAVVSAERINEVLETKPKIVDGQHTEGLDGEIGTVEFRNVSFRYPGAEEPILRNISFKAERGQTVAFIGATGSGKSTLINLIPRLYDATEGEILVDGVNVREYTQEALHEKLGYAPQKAVLFTGTVKSNVSYGTQEADEDQLHQAVQIAQAEEFVDAMEGTYDASIARGGMNVSGGQKQRLSIARAVARKPEFYIFDDTFSALDYKTDRVLRGELKKHTGGTTTLIVAQRIGTIRDADKIIVLDEGRIVGEGTHAELMKSCQVYNEIARTQLSEEELV